jgi:hypothetical protein
MYQLRFTNGWFLNVKTKQKNELCVHTSRQKAMVVLIRPSLDVYGMTWDYTTAPSHSIFLFSSMTSESSTGERLFCSGLYEVAATQQEWNKEQRRAGWYACTHPVKF